MSMSVQGVRVQRGQRQVLDGVELALHGGQLTAMLGPNGAGKSTLLAVMAGDLAPQTGQASLDGTPLSRCRPQALARRRAVLPQHSHLAFDLSVDEVVAMGAYPFPELSSGQLASLVAHALHLTDAQAFGGRRYGGLSGGEQQRVQCARVLAQALAGRLPGEEHTLRDDVRGMKPRYLLMDEPAASLDPLHQHGLLRALRALAHEHGMGVLVIAHDINLAARWCDRMVFLAAGRVVADGPPEQVLDPLVLERVYGLPARLVDDGERRLLVFDS